MIKWAGPLTLLLILTLGGLLWGGLNQPVAVVRVTGDLNAYEREAIVDAVSPSLDKGLLRLNLDVVKADIQALSWPRHVSLRRLWPAGLAIDVYREQPVARWGAGGYVSTRGSVMPGSPADSADLPTFHCESASPQEAMEVYRGLGRLVAGAGVEISSLRESVVAGWVVELSVAGSAGPHVVLGRDHLVERMERFVVVYGQVLREQLDAVRYADARYANGVAVRWNDPLLAFGAEVKHGIRR